MYESKYVCTYMQMYVCLHVHICVCVSYVLELNSSSCRYTADMLAHTSFKSNGCLCVCCVGPPVFPYMSVPTYTYV